MWDMKWTDYYALSDMIAENFTEAIWNRVTHNDIPSRECEKMLLLASAIREVICRVISHLAGNHEHFQEAIELLRC